MDFWISSARGDLEKLLLKVDGLVLNYDEAEQMTACNPVAAARNILTMGPKFVVVKKGEHALLIHKDARALPAYPAEKVIDPTAVRATHSRAA